MKKLFLSAAAVLLAVSVMFISVVGVSAAVYLNDGNFTYKLNDDFSLEWAGYTSETVDDVIVPRNYNGSTVVGVAGFGLENNVSIKSIDFMSSPELTYIGRYAFSGCSSLESVTVPDSITEVDISAFRGCTALTDVVFYGNQNIVPVECFYNCNSLTNVRLSAYLKSIQSRAFAGCTSLQYLELIDTVSYIAPNAFDGDTNLTLGVWYGSYAYEYAKAQDINYVLLDNALLGDANGDNRVNINDVTKVQRALAELEELTGIRYHAADINNDGTLAIDDASLVQAYLAEYEVAYAVGEVMIQ